MYCPHCAGNNMDWVKLKCQECGANEGNGYTPHCVECSSVLTEENNRRCSNLCDDCDTSIDTELRAAGAIF